MHRLPAAKQRGAVFADFSTNDVETYRKMPKAVITQCGAGVQAPQAKGGLTGKD